MSTSILAIHGAFSTPKIFNYLKREFRIYDWNFLDYKDTVSDINGLIARAARAYSQHAPCHIVGHSMGGLVGLALAHQPWVRSVTTIATPLGGLDVNLFQSYFSRSTFFNEISSYSDFVTGLHRREYAQPIQHIISTEGFNPWVYERTDGVVTLRSQRAWSAGPTYDVEANHSEVMLHPNTVTILKKFWAAGPIDRDY
ncbi:Alpha/beta hydrolase fold-1 [uncultured Caudovirales phage]|uniref:Alpha/beta hydrolase fold-1 n=1 Tax=uncultured Caudovirales phage TaxID=2100421 RepID=A0A6J5KQL8_9CAUD|nr:Alpha/beta hydrolase fold-1 [uncultured Caudovirales phage]